MDPLSITVSSIALAKVVIKGAKTLQELLGAREDIQSLVDEVTQLNRVFEDAQVLLGERKKHLQLPQNMIDAGVSILSQAQNRLEKLRKLLGGCIKQASESGKKLKPVYIAWLRSRKEIKKVQQDLMDARLGLSTFWGGVQV